MKLKALAAVVALAFAGTANAAFDNDEMTSGPGYGDGDGSMVLSVVDDTSGVDTSIAIDLGLSLTADQFMYGNVASGTVALTGNADLNSFLSSTSGTVKWDVTGIVNNGGNGDFAMLQTVVGGAMPAHNDQTVMNAMGAQGAWYNSIAGVATGDVAIFADATAPGGHFDDNSNIPASVNQYPTDSLLGDTVDFLAIAAGYGPSGAGMDLLDFTLNWDGSNATLTYGTASTIPVPAAAWLFGSAMLGMVGVARRKAA